jgi:hypothetical protein
MKANPLLWVVVAFAALWVLLKPKKATATQPGQIPKAPQGPGVPWGQVIDGTTHLFDLVWPQGDDDTPAPNEAGGFGP